MDIPDIIGRERELFTFMKANGFPVFHQSNIFLRDIQYGVRDFCRTTFKKDIGTRKSDALAEKIIRDLESKGVLQRFTDGVWILQMQEFVNPPKVEEKKAEAAA
jgi:hypothetical protein